MSLRIKYACGGCQFVHDDEDSALVCCAPKVIELYECPTCGCPHDRRNKAVECCLNPEVESLTPAQLEIIGQQRLFQ